MNGYIIFEEQVTAVIDKYKELSFKIEDGIPCVFGSIILVDEYGNIDAESQVLKDFQLIQYDLIRKNGYIKQDSDFFKLGD